MGSANPPRQFRPAEYELDAAEADWVLLFRMMEPEERESMTLVVRAIATHQLPPHAIPMPDSVAAALSRVVN